MYTLGDLISTGQIILAIVVMGWFCVGIGGFLDQVGHAYNNAIIDLPLVIRRK